MKRLKLNPVVVATIILAIAGIPLLFHQWKLGGDRSGCLMNMRNMYQTIYSSGGMEGVGPDQPIPGGIRRLLALGGFQDLPICPSGGVYTFVSETTYSDAGVNNNIRCSRADDLGHVYLDGESESNMDFYTVCILGGLLVSGIVYTVIDICYGRRQIDRFLRVGGARIQRFRWKPFLGWRGADSRSKHYEVTFEDHSGRIIQAVFIYTPSIGVMKTSDRILKEPTQAV